jgi:hypothetical protein
MEPRSRYIKSAEMRERCGKIYFEKEYAHL